MEFGIEQRTMLIMKSVKRQIMERIEVPTQEKCERLEKRKPQTVYEYLT